MKFKLCVHQRTFSEEDVVINPRDFPNLVAGDVLEIYHPDDDSCHLLLQVKSLDVDFQQKDTISVDQSIAAAFMLRPYSDVYVNKVSEEHGVLDMTELTLKDQYLNASDMWRLRQSLIGSCVYLSKKINFAGMRVQVNEMWAQGEKVACGKISKDTKVLFRSQSAQIHLFLQMSAEMWEFDLFGDLYFERATNGFLTELFAKWKEKNCTHEVTIILFSRTHYQAKSIDEFPTDMQRNIQRSTDGLFYQDFFKTVTFSEKCDDWKTVVMQLKKNFTNYLRRVGCTKESTPTGSPRGWNSRAFEGNVLEAINVSLNAFEKYFVDCSLELTNWSMIVVTPGQGVFNVCKELTGLTKQRVMDSGVGIDLVCLAEQPLHAVPLFRCINRKDQMEGKSTVTEDYYIPPWINFSFYSSLEQTKTCPRFIPRMKIPEKSVLSDADTPTKTLKRRSDQLQTLENMDFDKYDAQVFHLDTRGSSYDSRHKTYSRKRGEQDQSSYYRFSPDSSVKQMTNGSQELSQSRFDNKHSTTSLLHSRLVTDPVETSMVRGSLSVPDIPVRPNSDDAVYSRHFENPESPQDSDAVNPFKPYSYSYKRSLFRHRWQHVFPTGPRGEAMQEHHKVISGSESPLHDVDLAAASIGRQNVLSGASGSTEIEEMDGGSEADSISIKTSSEPGADEFAIKLNKRITQVWKTMSRPDDWSDPLFLAPTTETGGTIMTYVDWKSLTVPACLPLTTDYFPDRRTLEDEYVEYNYNLIIDDSLQAEIAVSEDKLFGRSKMTAKQKFDEIISQRLAQGFQLVTNKERLKIVLAYSERSRHTLKFTPEVNLLEEHVLSLGNNIHHVQLCGWEVIVNKYAARNIPNHKPFDYKYNLWPHTFDGFCPARTRFSHEGLEKYNWNYLDQYVTSAEGEFNQLSEDLKYWRVRFVLLPIRNHADQNCTADEEMTLIEGFLRLLEAVNRIRRPTNYRQLFQTRKLRDSTEMKEKRRHTPQSIADQSRNTKRNEKNERGSREKITEEQSAPKQPQKADDVAKVAEKAGESESQDKAAKSKGNGSYVEKTPQRNAKKNEGDEDKVTSEKEQIKGDAAKDGKNTLKPEPDKQKSESKSKEGSRRDLTKADSDPRTKRKSTKDLPNVANEAVKKEKDKRVSSSTDELVDTSPTNEGETKKTVAETSMNPSKMPPEHALSTTSELDEIIRVMQNPEYGLSFLPEFTPLRPWTFISAEAVAWMIKSVDGVDTKADAVAVAQKLLDSDLIVHASGTSKEEFKDGFVLYFIDQSDNSNTKAKKGEEELLRKYNTHWVEVAVWRESIPDNVPLFLQPDPLTDQQDIELRMCTPVYKSIDLKVDPLHKSDRPEWCVAYYHGNYFPRRAFSLELHWMVATGCIVSDLVQGWARKASGSGLHLIPAPVNPFPIHLGDGKGNPLLKPVFIPLAMDCLIKEDKRHIFHEFEKGSWDKRILLLQESILFKFGFLRDTPKSTLDDGWPFDQREFPRSHYYVHWSGSTLVKIEGKKADSALISPSSSRPSSASFGKTERELVTYRQTSSRVKLAVNRVLMDLEDQNEDKKHSVGFFCINNYAMTKKWRSNVTGDQEIASKLVSDFRDFCTNKDNALLKYWTQEYESYFGTTKGNLESSPNGQR